MDKLIERLEALLAFRQECAERLTAITDTAADDEERSNGRLTETEQAEFDQLAEWVSEARTEEDDINERLVILRAAQTPANVTRGDQVNAPNINRGNADDVDFDALTRGRLTSAEVRDAALATIERQGKRYRVAADGLENAERLARKGDGFASHIATFGQDVYAEAWAKHMTGRDYLLDGAEARALAVGTATSAGSLVPSHLDPSIILSNAGAQNPFRQISRVVSLASPGPNSWNGVSSAGVTASWDAEAAEVSDDSPVTVQYAIPTHKGQAYVEASYETIEDVAGLGGEIVTLFADAKDRLESAAFATGSGSAQPTGIVTALDANTFVEVNNTTAATLGLVDLHAALNGLSARFRDRSTWVMSPTILGTIQQLGTAVSASFSTDLTANYTNQILGRPAALSSSFPGTPSSTTEVENWLAVGDFGALFTIVDKIGLRTVFNPVALSNTTTRPSGSAGWLMHWRVGSEPTYTGDATTTRAFVLLQDITSA